MDEGNQYPGLANQRASWPGLPCELGRWVCDRPEMVARAAARTEAWVRPADLSSVFLHGLALTLLTLQPCHSALSPQLARYTKEGFLHLGALGTTTLLPDTRCLVDNSKSRLPQLLDCDKVKSSLYKRWNFIQVSAPWTGLAPQSR